MSVSIGAGSGKGSGVGLGRLQALQMRFRMKVSAVWVQAICLVYRVCERRLMPKAFSLAHSRTPLDRSPDRAPTMGAKVISTVDLFKEWCQPS